MNMHQSMELRIQAVRLLKVMGALDELWTVVQKVRCPYTKQAAIDSIPALEVRIQEDDQGERVVDDGQRASVAASTAPATEKVEVEDIAEETVAREADLSGGSPGAKITDLEKNVLSYLYTRLTKDGIEAVTLPVISSKTEIKPDALLQALTNLKDLQLVKRIQEDKRGFTRELFGITNQGIKYAELKGANS